MLTSAKDGMQVAERQDELRILALVPTEMQEQIRNQLAPLAAIVDFISWAAELSSLDFSDKLYQVVLLPAALPDSGWWNLWAQITLLHPRPEILVYAHTASFQLWSGVLELGGYDVIIEPFTDEDIRSTILRAAKSFQQRSISESAAE
jgi:DNA-binding NtrC family response regulator